MATYTESGLHLDLPDYEPPYNDMQPVPLALVESTAGVRHVKTLDDLGPWKPASATTRREKRS